MKKLISMMLAMFLATAWAANVCAFSDMENTLDIMLLKRLNVISGYEDGTLRPDEYLTRAEAVTTVLALDGFTPEVMEGNKATLDAMENPPTFSDIDKSHWAYYNVLEGVIDGVISGFEDGTFRPEEDVTWAQAVRMLMSSTRYDHYAQAYGGYPSGYIEVAKRNDIFKNIDISRVNADKKITRGNFLELTARTFNMPYLMQERDEQAGIVFSIKDGTGDDFESLLIRNFSVYEVTAEVVSTADDTVDVDITEARNFNHQYIGSNDKPVRISAKICDEDKNTFKKGKKYKMYIEMSNGTKEEYKIVCAVLN